MCLHQPIYLGPAASREARHPECVQEPKSSGTSMTNNDLILPKVHSANPGHREIPLQSNFQYQSNMIAIRGIDRN
jgi:hypothetical protein